jgi:hypothetical protein
MLSESEAAQTGFPDVTGSSVGVEEFGCPQISGQEQETAFRSVLSLRERWRDCIELLEALKDWLRYDQPIRKSLQFLLVMSRLKKFRINALDFSAADYILSSCPPPVVEL